MSYKKDDKMDEKELNKVDYLVCFLPLQYMLRFNYKVVYCVECTCVEFTTNPNKDKIRLGKEKLL